MNLRTASLALLSSSLACSSRPNSAAFVVPGVGDVRGGVGYGGDSRRRYASTALSAVGTDRDQKSAEFTTRVPSTRTSDGVVTPATGGGSSSSTASSTTSTALYEIMDSQREFELNLGRAADALKSDYPTLLTRDPTWSVYHPELEVVDPTGVSLHGVENYKMAFGFVHGVVKWFYCEEKSGLTFRVGYDWARKCIRISWNVELVPRMIYGGTRNILHVDGISEYYLDRESGLITKHKVSHLLINDQPIRPENGIFNALAEMSPVDPEGVPVFFRGAEDAASTNQAERTRKLSGRGRRLKWEDMTHVKFQTWNPLRRPAGGGTSLFSNPNESAMDLPNQSDMNMNGEQQVPYDRDALQRRNASRKKFGMRPLTPEEFVVIEEEVRAMDSMNKKKAAYLAERLAQEQQSSRKKEGLLERMFGGALRNGCESNFDCERPEVCCDVGFKKICCSNGLGIVDGIPLEKWERARLRVPMGNDNVDY